MGDALDEARRLLREAERSRAAVVAMREQIIRDGRAVAFGDEMKREHEAVRAVEAAAPRLLHALCDELAAAREELTATREYPEATGAYQEARDTELRSRRKAGYARDVAEDAARAGAPGDVVEWLRRAADVAEANHQQAERVLTAAIERYRRVLTALAAWKERGK